MTFDKSQYMEDISPAEIISEDAAPPPSQKLTFDVPRPETDTPSAPFGYDADGNPLTPYGIGKDGRIKKTAGRPSLKKTGPQTGAATDEKILGARLLESDAMSVAEASPESDEKQGPEAAEKKELHDKYRVYISGAMALVVLDFLACNVICKIYSLVTGEDISKDDLRLTDDEKKDMVDLMDIVVKDLFDNLSPMKQAGIYLAVLYGTKISFAKKTPRKKKAVKNPVAEG